jgi:hypothetical protein
MRYFLFVFVVVSVTACYFSFGFKTDLSLKNKYDHTQKAENVNFFYNVSKNGDLSTVDMTVKNTSNMYMANLVVYVDTKKMQDYFYVGNLKHLSSKKVKFQVPADAKQVKLRYRYSLLSEDSFLNPSEKIPEDYSQESSVILFLK